MKDVDRFVEDLIDKNIVLMRENAELRKAVHANEQKTQTNVNTEAK